MSKYKAALSEQKFAGICFKHSNYQMLVLVEYVVTFLEQFIVVLITDVVLCGKGIIAAL